jgi:hypothetical protein
MISRFHVLQQICFIGSCILGSALCGAEQSEWIFEGRLDHVDPILSPAIKSGWVLSGSFLYDAEAMELDQDAATTGLSRHTGGITDGELTLDLYYQMRFSARQRNGPAGLDYLHQQNDPEASLIVFIPQEGSLEKTEWSLQWLQISLSGDWSHVPGELSDPLEWQSGWFRLIFSNGNGQKAYAVGTMTLFGLAGLAELQEQGAWEAAVGDLGRILEERDAKILRLETDLSDIRGKVSALQGMLDLMADRRLELETENQLLEKALMEQTSSREKETAFLVEKALLEDSLNTARAKNNELSEQLNAMTQVAAELQIELDALKGRDVNSESAIPKAKALAPVESTPSSSPQRNISYPKFEVASEPQTLEDPTNSSVDVNPVPPNPPARRSGPRKFR